MNYIDCILICGFLIWASNVSFADDGSEQAFVQTPIFTAAQASRGQVLYQSSCAGCHGLELIPDDASVASLTALEFRIGWQGKTIAEQLTRISNTMPPGGTANLELADYLDIIAFILSFNGYPPGQEELPQDKASLEAIFITSGAPIE